MRYVQFVYLREGSADEPLLAHLEALLVREGADEVLGEVRPYRGSVSEKLAEFLAEELPVDLIFLHRDADRAGHVARESEVYEAAASLPGCPPVVPVVPTTMTEAWLLVDETAIRAIAGNPKGSMDIGLPPLHGIEGVADAKARLKQCIGVASGATGAELARLNGQYSSNRAALLSRLNPDGRVRHLPSWVRLEEDVQSFIARTPRTSARGT